MDAPKTERGPDPRDAHRFPRPDVELEWLLERLLQAVGRPYDAQQVRDAVLECSARGAGMPAIERLSRAAITLSLRPTSIRTSTREVLETVGPERPAVALGPSGWVLLDGRAGGRARVHRPGHARAEWLDPRALEAYLTRPPEGASDGAASGPWKRPTGEPAEVEWLLVDPVAPLEGARARDHGEHGAHTPTPLARLTSLLRIEREDVFTVLVYAAGVGVLGLAIPIAVQSLVNTVAFGTLFQPLVVLVAVLLVVLGFAAVLQVLEFWVVELIQRRLFVRLVADMGDRLPRVAIDRLGDRNLPEVVNRFFDVFSVQKTLAFLLLDSLAIVLTAITGMLVLAFYHPYLLAFDIVLVVGITLLVLLPAKPAIATAVVESKKKYRVASWFEDVARNIPVFKHGGAAEHQRYRAETLARDYLDARKDHFRYVLRQVVAALALQVVASAALLGIGGWLVIERELTLGQLVAAELIVATVVGSLAKLGKHLESFYDLLASVDKVGHLLDLPVEDGDGDRFLEVPSPAGSRLELRGVEVGYDGATVLSVDTLTIGAGQRVALTGPSGAGKSTLLDALFGLRPARSGRLEIDGSDVRDLMLEELRSRVALVRGAEVFHATIVENVRVGRPGLALGEVRRALDAVGLYEEVARLDEGLQTELSSDGAPLSSGQLLRLAAARALAARPSLVLVDDVIDRLETGARRRVLDALAGEGVDRRTVIVVSESPDVQARCDRVLRVEDGRVVDRVPHSTEAA